MVSYFKSYKKNFDYSYTFGMFPTIELINEKPELVKKVVVRSNLRHETGQLDIYEYCEKKHIEIEQNDKLIDKIGQKENCYVIGIFKKYHMSLDVAKPHIVLVNPSNMGNVGTIIRTAAGFGINDMALISPCVDIFDPKVIRASMGALFRINFKYYNCFEEYKKQFMRHEIYTFMLDGVKTLKEINIVKPKLFALVFGNEATGLDEMFKNQGTSVLIKHTNQVDSLNLTIAVGIALYEFCS